MRSLEGVRILDFTGALLGRFGTFLLRALGAEVIAIGRAEAGSSVSSELYERALAFNKTLIGVNLKDPRGRQFVLDLAVSVDVVVDNFRPGTMERLGLGVSAIHARNPQAVVVSCSTAGSAADQLVVGYAPIFAALSGLSALTGYEDGPPVELRHPVDATAGLSFALAVVFGLLRRKATGSGCYVDVSARDAIAWTLGHEFLAAQLRETPEVPSGQLGSEPAIAARIEAAAHDPWSIADVFETEEGAHLALAVRTDEEWARTCGVLGIEAALQCKGASATLRRLHRHDLVEALRGALRQRSSEVVLALSEAGVPVSEVMTNAGALTGPMLWERGSLINQQIGGQERQVLGLPWRQLGAERGAETKEGERGLSALKRVAREVGGMSEGHVQELLSQGVISAVAWDSAD